MESPPILFFEGSVSGTPVSEIVPLSGISEAEMTDAMLEAVAGSQNPSNPPQPPATADEGVTTGQAEAQSASTVTNACPALIAEVFGVHAPAACAVSWCESGWNPSALGDHGVSYGLFQLNTGWSGPSGPYGWASWYGVEPAAFYDPVINTMAAKAIFDYSGGNFSQWTCRP